MTQKRKTHKKRCAEKDRDAEKSGMKSVNCRGPERERRAGRQGDTERKADRNGQRWRAARRRGPHSDFLLSSGVWRVGTG